MNDLTQDQKELAEIKTDLLSSLLHFTKVFYKLRTGRDFVISKPVSRESHHITICKALTRCLYLKSSRLLINVEPGSGKSELLIHFIAWALAHYPDSQFIYVSFSHTLAASHTATIREIINLPAYSNTFDVHISTDKAAADDFQTTAGGRVYAAGSSGTITGVNAGLPISDRFSGCLIMDDMHKPDEVFSDTTREKVVNNYSTTLIHRPRAEIVPQIFLGQRTHERDLPSIFINGEDGYEWEKVILPSRDVHGNVLNPRVHSEKFLKNLEEKKPYEYYSQYQQKPQPAGGTIWREEWFVKLENAPDILATFITADTAETDKTWNDATVFSFWGLYQVKQFDEETGLYGLHWLDCRELFIQPKDMQNEFMDFYRDCMRHPVKPQIAAIEKKSTGVTLLSILQDMQGIKLLDVDRTNSKKPENDPTKNRVVTTGSKTARFIGAQPYIASKLITLPIYGMHANMCIEHCGKITANETHAKDDIADTLCDAIKIALIDKLIVAMEVKENAESEKKIIDAFVTQLNKFNQRAY
jgi:hypothetical protein